MGIAFNQATRDLLDCKNVATVATLNPDGAPRTSVVCRVSPDRWRLGYAA